MQNNIASNMTPIEVLQSDKMTLCTEKTSDYAKKKKKISNQRDCSTNYKKKEWKNMPVAYF